MNDTENLYLQGLKIAVDTLAAEIAKQRQEAALRGRYADLPEWLDLRQAVVLKRGLCAEKKRAIKGKGQAAAEVIEGGASYNTYQQKLSLQPCCGLNYKVIGGRRCWKKEDVIEWLGVTDSELEEDQYQQKNKKLFTTMLNVEKAFATSTKRQ